MQQAMASEVSAGAPSGQSGPSFDAAIGDALQQAAKAVADDLKKPEAKKK
jgi:hypothetical protein